LGLETRAQADARASVGETKDIVPLLNGSIVFLLQAPKPPGGWIISRAGGYRHTNWIAI